MPAIPTWDGACGFNHEIDHDYNPDEAYTIRTHKIQMKEGIGTHIDAPAHFVPEGKTISRLDLEDLIAPCIVVDVSAKAHEKYTLSSKEMVEFEEQYGAIRAGSFVIIHTGWGQYWNDPQKYHNHLVFPSVSSDAASLLLERGIVGLGIDTLSPDRPEDGFPVHQMMLSSGKYIVENIANANHLPPIKAYSLVLPMKIKDGAEAPVRLIGLLYD